MSKNAIDNMASWYEENSTAQPADNVDPMSELRAKRDSGQSDMSPMEKLTLGFHDLQEAQENVKASTSTEEESAGSNETDAETTTDDSTASGTEDNTETSTASTADDTATE